MKEEEVLECKLSIIIPVYNGESFLQRCLDSLICSSTKEIEIIIVNDGSNDNTESICKKYAESDERIHYYYKSNGGQSSARNLGLEKAKGKYVCFVDSDDWVAQNYPETILSCLNEDKLDLLYFATEIRKPDIGKIRDTKSQYQEKTLKNKADTLDFMCNIYLKNWTNHVCDKCYRMEIIKNNSIRFVTNDKILEEDLCFNLLYIPYIRNACCIDKILYYYILRDDSTMGKARNRWDIRIHKMGRLLKIVHDTYNKNEENNLLAQKFPFICAAVLHKMTFDLPKSQVSKLTRYFSNRDFLIQNWKYILNNWKEAASLFGKKRGIYIIIESYLFIHSGKIGCILGGIEDLIIRTKRYLLGNREL